MPLTPTPGDGGVTYPSPDEWPVTYVEITGITKGSSTVVTAVDHGITLSSTASTPGVNFSLVKGMQQINGAFGYVVDVIDDDNIRVAIDSTNFYEYTSGGFIHKIVGSAPIDPLTNLFP